jgi:hypothetical protein
LDGFLSAFLQCLVVAVCAVSAVSSTAIKGSVVKVEGRLGFKSLAFGANFIFLRISSSVDDPCSDVQQHVVIGIVADDEIIVLVIRRI